MSLQKQFAAAKQRNAGGMNHGSLLLWSAEQAEQERQQAEQEQQRADRWAAKLRELDVDPDAIA